MLPPGVGVWEGAWPSSSSVPPPSADQHWSDEVVSDTDTELRRRHQAEAEEDLQLRVSEDNRELPSATPWGQGPGQSQNTSWESHKGHRRPARQAHCTLLAPRWPPLTLHTALHITLPTAPLCVSFGTLKG